MYQPGSLSLEMVQLFMISQGGKVPNHELVKQFKSYLNNTENKDAVRLVFKDIVNEIATVHKEGNEKFLLLKPKYMRETNPEYNAKYSSKSVTDLTPQLTNTVSVPNIVNQAQPYEETPQRDNVEMRRAQIEFQPQYSEKMVWDQINTPRLDPPLSHCQSSPNLLIPCEDEADSQANNSLYPPQPPPRRKASTRSKENRGTKIEEKLRQLNEERGSVQSSPPKSVRDEEILGMSLSPGIVKERAKKINKMASEVDVSIKSTPGSTNLSSSLSRSTSSVFSSSSQLNSLSGFKRHSKAQDDDDSTSVTTLDPNSKQWVLQAAKGDYCALVKLLQEEPKLAGFKDFISGYTALHWAAKHGKDEIVKLISGTYKVNPNVRSHGGYTPLHLAAMFRQEHIMELLVNTYGADPSIRDYSGKRPDQYLPSTPYSRNFSKLASGSQEESSKSSSPFQQGAFVRIGSLNSKVRKTAASMLGGASNNGGSKKTSLTRIKSWGSAESLTSDYQSSMPPPKFLPKKKKTKKTSADSVTSISSIISDNVFLRPRSENSDSDSGPSSFV